MSLKKQHITIIAGPTAVGKTDIALRLARKYKFEIISADSMQVYKYLDIGTAKASKEEHHEVRFHLIDCVAPDEQFDVAQFINLAEQAISDIRSRGNRPLLVGGTGMYIHSLIQGIFNEPGKDEAIRQRLEEEMRTKGLPALHKKLTEMDPDAAARIHPSDRLRIIRALEVFHLTGKTITSLHEQSRKDGSRYDTTMIVLDRERADLYHRIDKRVDTMIERGLLDEVQKILALGYSTDCPGLQALGYKESILYLSGRISFDEYVQLVKRNTRRYAKRQLTWFRNMPDIIWIKLDEQHEEANQKKVEEYIATFQD